MCLPQKDRTVYRLLPKIVINHIQAPFFGIFGGLPITFPFCATGVTAVVVDLQASPYAPPPGPMPPMMYPTRWDASGICRCQMVGYVAQQNMNVRYVHG